MPGSTRSSSATAQPRAQYKDFQSPPTHYHRLARRETQRRRLQPPGAGHPLPQACNRILPHPDDDVISMGGTIYRLVGQGHDVHIAYETSGNIAVADEEATRFMHFVNGFNQIFDLNCDFIPEKYSDVKNSSPERKRASPTHATFSTSKASYAAGRPARPAHSMKFRSPMSTSSTSRSTRADASKNFL